VGDVTPAPDDCRTPERESCVTTPPVCFGGPASFVPSHLGTAVRVDSNGDTILGGSFGGTVNLGGSLLDAGTGQSPFVAKFTASGSHIWSLDGGSDGYSKAWGIAVDAVDSTVVVGAFENTLDLGGGPLTSAGFQDVFVAKIDSAGNHLWSQRFGDSEPQSASAVAVDPLGNVVLVGSFRGTIDFGGVPMTSTTSGEEDIFVAKLDAAGNHIWSKQFGAANYQFASAVAIDSAGAIVLTGSFRGSLNFGGSLLSSSQFHPFLAKLNSDGSHVWSRDLDVSGDMSADKRSHSLAIDGADNVLVVGAFGGTIDLGGGPMVAASQSHFVAKLDSAGTFIWGQNLGDYSPGGTPIAVSTDLTDDSVVIAGGFENTIDFSGTQIVSAGADDIFVAKLGEDGSHLWSYAFGDASDHQQARAVAVDAQGFARVTGSLAGAATLTGEAVDGGPTGSVFLIKAGP
jgi:hypothetical protein